MVLLVRRLYYSDDIPMIDIHTDPIKHQIVEKLHETNISNLLVFNLNIVSVLKLQHLVCKNCLDQNGEKQDQIDVSVRK